MGGGGSVGIPTAPGPSSQVDMPVFFYVDPEFLDDRTMRRVNTMTLSYTFFRASDLGGPVSGVYATAQ